MKVLPFQCQSQLITEVPVKEQIIRIPPATHLTMVKIVALTGLVMSVFEATKYEISPRAVTWTLDLATIVFVMSLSATMSHFVLTRDERLRREMASNEMRYRLMFWKSLTGAYRSTLDGRILDCNVAFCRMLGYSAREELIGQSVNVGYINAGDRARFINKLQEKGELTNFEERLRRKDGSTVWVLISATVVANEVGEGLVIKGTMTDITDRIEAQQENRRLADIVRCSDDSIISVSTEGIIQSWNAGAERTYGYSAAETLGKSVSILVPADRVAEMNEILEQWTTGREVKNLELVRVRKDGEQIIIQLTISPIRDLTGDVVGASTIARDITGNKRAEKAIQEAEEKYRAIFEDAVIGIFQVTPDGRLISVNRALAQMHGYDSPEELLEDVSGSGSSLIVDSSRMTELSEMVAERCIVRGAEVEIYSKDRARKWVRVNLRAVRDASGGIALYEGTVEDITDQKAAEERMKFLAFYDALTELPNRALLQDRLDNALTETRRRSERIALLFLDLDRFKGINDAFGHPFGDLVLKGVAKRLKECVREHTVARVGGDEFLILLSNLRDPADAAIAANRVMDAMAKNFTIQGQTLRVGCSIGVSIFPDHGEDGETLIRNADAAMYSAKNGGRSNARFFTDEMNAQVLERLTMDKNLRQALAQSEFFLVYQPQMEIATGTITGLEALIRWQHPELGLIPPDRFIPIAEDNGLILPIGEWVLSTACAQVRKWQDEGLCALPIAVNVSAVQFRQESFLALVRTVLHDTGLSPEYLELEITESVLLTNEDVMCSALQELKDMGLKLTIDDFGTGYSSLSYLRRFPVTKLKIDKSFVRDIAIDCDDAAITAAIISLAKSLHIKVIAEGVEDEVQLSFLREHRCDEIQGYYFSKPLSADEAATLLRYEHGYQVALGRSIAAPSVRDTVCC